MNNITIGQYVPGKSWIYKMDPRMKIILTFFLMVIIFLLPTVYSVAIALGLFLIMFLTTGIPLMKMIKGLKPVMFLVIFTFVLQLIYNKEGKLLKTVEFTFGLYQLLSIIGITVFYIFTKKYIPFKMIYMLLFFFAIFAVQYLLNIDKFEWFNYHLRIYEKGIERGLFVFFRVIVMIGITSLLTFTTMTTDINNGISSVLKPLKIIKVPVGVIAMMLSLTLRFIPTLLDETNKIMKAQASRGVDFNEGRLKDKVTQIISLLVPMFVISIRRAEDLSNAMIARGYEIDAPRTQLDLLKLRLVDYSALVVTILLLAGTIYYRIAF